MKQSQIIADGLILKTKLLLLAEECKKQIERSNELIESSRESIRRSEALAAKRNYE